MKTTQTKIQLRGNCPCCGRNQAVNSGMSKHGYRVDNGWFEGVCSGQNEKPMQQDRTITEAIVKSIREEVGKLRAKLAELKAGEWHPNKCALFSIYNKLTMVSWEDASDYEQQCYLEKCELKFHNRARQGERFSNELEALLNKFHGQKLQEVIKS